MPELARNEARRITIPNMLTVGRLGLSVVAAGLFLGDVFERLGVLLCAGAIVLDWLDGQLARRLGQETKIGAYLDPIADKFAMGVVYAVIAVHAKSELIWVFFCLLLARDVIVTGYRSIGYHKDGVFASTGRVGRFKTALQGVCGVGVLFYAYYVRGDFSFSMVPVTVLMSVVVALSYVSAGAYINSQRRCG